MKDRVILSRRVVAVLPLLTALVICLVGPQPALADSLARFSFWSIDPYSSTTVKYVRVGGGLPTPVADTICHLSYVPTSIVSTGWVDGDPAGQRVYIADNAKGLIWQYVADLNGRLIALNPPNVAAGRVIEMRLDQASNIVYALRPDGPTSLKIRDNGTLNLRKPAPTPIGSIPDAMVLSPSGQNLYVVCTAGRTTTIDRGLRKSSPAGPNGSIAQYSVGIDGALTAIDPPTVSVSYEGACASIDRTGRLLYIGSSTATSLATFRVDAGGALEPVDGNATVQLLAPPLAIIADPIRPYLYAVIGNIRNTGLRSQMLVFHIGSDGELMPVAVGRGLPIVDEFQSVIFDTEDKCLYLIGIQGAIAAGFRLADDGRPFPEADAVTIKAPGNR